MQTNLAPSSPLLSLFYTHAVASMEKQLQLERLLQDEDKWHLDLAQGQIRFKDEHGRTDTFAVQLLGTVSQDSKSWFWGWADTQTNVPPALLTDASSVKQFGEKHNVLEFVTPQVDLRELDPNILCLVASGVVPLQAYCSFPSERGTIFLSLRDDRLQERDDNAATRAAFAIPQSLICLPLSDHKRAIREFLTFLGQTIDEHPDRFLVYEDQQPVIVITFDSLERMTTLHVLVGDKEPPDIPADALPQ